MEENYEPPSEPNTLYHSNSVDIKVSYLIPCKKPSNYIIRGGKTHFSKAARFIVLLAFSPSAVLSRLQGRFALSPRAKGRFRPCKERGREDSPPCPHAGGNRFQNFVREPFLKKPHPCKRDCGSAQSRCAPAKRIAGD